MRKRRILLICCGFGFLVTIHFGWKLTARSAYESAEYIVVESDDSIEIREYPDLMLVTTSMQYQSRGDDGSFMRLFRYIAGANEQDQKVAMTTPVFMEREHGSKQGQMGFVIPKQVSDDGIPVPSGEAVQIQKRMAGKFAVIRFPGRIDEQTVQAKRIELRNWMVERGLSGDGPAEVAGYDPPWTPRPLRRNELLIRLSDRDQPQEILQNQ
jgi:hypothetical protein